MRDPDRLISCPVCNRPADSLAVNPELDRMEHALALRVRPKWSPEHGICQRCVAAFRESARRLREREPVRSDNFRQYRRYYLTRVESGQWNHRNPNMAAWRRAQILRHVMDAVERDGVNLWALLDADERLVAQGAEEAFKWFSKAAEEEQGILAMETSPRLYRDFVRGVNLCRATLRPWKCRQNA